MAVPSTGSLNTSRCTSALFDDVEGVLSSFRLGYLRQCGRSASPFHRYEGYGAEESRGRMKSEYYGEYYEHENNHWWFKWRFDMITRIVDSLPRPEGFRMLDAGCGTGQMT